MTEKIGYEERLPHVSIVLPPSSTEDDARAAGRDVISGLLEIDQFEIVHVEMVEEGIIQSVNGKAEGKRYLVAFRQIHSGVGAVVFIHPDYDRIMENFPKLI